MISLLVELHICLELCESPVRDTAVKRKLVHDNLSLALTSPIDLEYQYVYRNIIVGPKDRL